MSNLIGPLGTQIPTNNMLGRLAYCDALPPDLVQSTQPGAASPTQIQTWATAGQVTFIGVPTYNASGGIAASAIVWPDGTSGIYTADTFDAHYKSVANAWHVSYIGTAATNVATQSLITRNTNLSGGAISTPAITVA